MKHLMRELEQSDAIVHVVDDDEAVLDSVGLLLSSIGINHCTYSNGQALLDAYSKTDFAKAYGCILMDIRMPLMSGIECQYQLEKLACTLPIIFVTGHGDVPTAVETMKHGAFDFIQKPFREQVLIDAIQKALFKNISDQSKIKIITQTRAKLATLTARETQILKEVVNGKANKVIAKKLSLSQRTIEIHRAHVMEKMEADSLAQLVKITLDAI